jgi:hypothetical protein
VNGDLPARGSSGWALHLRNNKGSRAAAQWLREPSGANESSANVSLACANVNPMNMGCPCGKIHHNRFVFQSDFLRIPRKPGAVRDCLIPPERSRQAHDNEKARDEMPEPFRVGNRYGDYRINKSLRVSTFAPDCPSRSPVTRSRLSEGETDSL